MSRIISIGTASPSYGVNQETILGFMQDDYADETANRKLSVLFQASGIKMRYSVVPDFNHEKHDNDFFSSSSVPDVETRHVLFKESSVILALAAVKNALNKLHGSIRDIQFTHLITVTCTGLHTPGIDATIIKKLGLPEDIFHVPLNFIGCNAAFPALKIADSIGRNDVDAKILLVCVELCTIHYHPKNNHDNLLSNTLFGDGAAACIIVNDSFADVNRFGGLKINGFSNLLKHEGDNLMGWNVTGRNFEMILSARVPVFISQYMDEFLALTWEKFQINPKDIDFWAIHPGGRKILDTVKDHLGLTEEQMDASYGVLSDFGNMSSATIFFVLNELNKKITKQGSLVCAIGFGPGLSFDSTWFTYA